MKDDYKMVALSLSASLTTSVQYRPLFQAWAPWESINHVATFWDRSRLRYLKLPPRRSNGPQVQQTATFHVLCNHFYCQWTSNVKNTREQVHHNMTGQQRREAKRCRAKWGGTTWGQ